MKKLFVFCITFLVSIAANAQNSFCSAIKEIEANTVNNFSSVGNFTKRVPFYNKGREPIEKGYKTSLTLPGFTLCFIGALELGSMFDPPYFYAEVEDFNSEAAAWSGLEGLKNKLSGCLPNYSIEKDPSHDDVGYVRNLFADVKVNYRFFQKKQNSDLLPRFFLRLEKTLGYGGSYIYTISLFVPGTGKEDPVKIAQKESIPTKNKQEQTTVNLSDNSSTCERLAWLFNHWQSGWSRMPKTLKQEEDDEGYVKKEYYTTSNTLVKYKTARIDGTYEETMYMRGSDLLDIAAKESRAFYDKICTDIKACLDVNAWTIENEGTPGEIVLGDISPHAATTHFISKGASKNQQLKSFKVVWNSPFANKDSRRNNSMYEVQLIFN